MMMIIFGKKQWCKWTEGVAKYFRKWEGGRRLRNSKSLLKEAQSGDSLQVLSFEVCERVAHHHTPKIVLSAIFSTPNSGRIIHY